MNTQTITLQIPKALFERFQEAAEDIHQPIETVMVQTLQGNVPPAVPSVAADVQEGLRVLQSLPDEQLWRVARSRLSADRQKSYEVLLAKNSQGSLTADEEKALERLSFEADLLTLKKAYAYALLRWRGNPLPPLESLT